MLHGCVLLKQSPHSHQGFFFIKIKATTRHHRIRSKKTGCRAARGKFFSFFARKGTKHITE
jgi:hypothetical protein